MVSMNHTHFWWGGCLAFRQFSSFSMVFHTGVKSPTFGLRSVMTLGQQQQQQLGISMMLLAIAQSNSCETKDIINLLVSQVTDKNGVPRWI